MARCRFGMCTGKKTDLTPWCEHHTWVYLIKPKYVLKYTVGANASDSDRLKKQREADEYDNYWNDIYKAKEDINDELITMEDRGKAKQYLDKEMEKMMRDIDTVYVSSETSKLYQQRYKEAKNIIHNYIDKLDYTMTYDQLWIRVNFLLNSLDTNNNGVVDKGEYSPFALYVLGIQKTIVTYESVHGYSNDTTKKTTNDTTKNNQSFAYRFDKNNLK